MLDTLPSPLPVLAMVEQTKETFSGQLVGEELLLVSSRGVSCRGRLRFKADGYGSGTLSCPDGRFGNVVGHMSGHMGIAYGTFDGRRFTLTVG